MNARILPHCLAGAILTMSFYLRYHPVLAQPPVGTIIPLKPMVRAVLFWKAGGGRCRETVTITSLLLFSFNPVLHVLTLELNDAKET